MGPIIAYFAGKGLSERAAKVAAWFAAALALVALLAAMWGAFQVWNHFDNKRAIERDRIEANNRVLQSQLEAAEAAARERLRNDRTNREEQEAFNDAIHHPQAGDHPDPGVRLACEQLRRQGEDTTDLPECGGR